MTWPIIGAQVLATVLKAGGEVVSGNAALTRGERSNAMDVWQAQQLEQNAGQAVAAGQAAAANQRIDTGYIVSQALARAAASGGGASDPTVINNIARIAQQGKYRENVAMYQGEERARAMGIQAQGKRYEGQLAASDAKKARNAGYFSGLNTVLAGATTMAKKYGWGEAAAPTQWTSGYDLPMGDY